MAKRAKSYKETWERRRKNLPFDSYQEFLNSEYWERIKRKAKSRISYRRCEFCGVMENLDLHHKHYDFIGQKHELNAIIAVCREHHQFIHDYAKEKDVSVFKSTKVAYNLFEKWRRVPRSMYEYKEIIKKRNGTTQKFEKYIFRESKQRSKAHIWNSEHEDTCCKMWSTGGLKQSKDWVVREDTSRRVCKVCLRHKDRFD